MVKEKVGVDIDALDYSKIYFLSNFPPKECGIATFTKDLTFALDRKFNPKLKSKIIALNEDTSFYNYGDKVTIQINKDDIEDFINKAKQINKSMDIKLVCIQHEFGMFGGEYGNYLIPFLETIEKPVVVTFHSILPDPDKTRKKIVRFIADKSAGIIVMAKKSIEILKNDYGVDESKIHVVMHGVPSVAFQSSAPLKKKLKLDNKIVLSSFGLLSEGKGIEYVIESLPKLVKKYPNLLYLIIGETHPVVRKNEGEKYRNMLIKRVEELGLKSNVKFYNKYLTLQEIINYLLASDIYVCSNLDRNQIVSGTLSYALGCGKAVVSTPSLYAEEVLAKNRGMLVEFKNPDSYVEAIDKILSDSELKKQLERNSYSFSRSMIWSNVATRYLSIFNKAVRLRDDTTEKYPSIKLRHLKNLTDNFGCIQFAKNTIPDKKSGYTVDDNSRALITAVLHKNLFKSEASLDLIKIYLNFMEFAQEEGGGFQNNFYNQNEKLDSHSEDSFGRAVWALGYTINKSDSPEIVEKAKELLEKSFDIFDSLKSPRAKAFSILGLSYHYKKYRDIKIILKIKQLADFLVDLYETQSAEDWHWFEGILAYSNSKLPEALFFAYELTGNEKYLKVAERTLNFLSDIVFVEGQLSPIGHNGWHNRNGERAFFDQQPVDASSMVQTYLIAYSITKNKEYHKKAVLSFNWFLGKNHLNQMIYDEVSGGCYDGLGSDALNINQGAESTVSYLLARLFLEEVSLGGG
tara:strand:+ start:4723 stop:6957 length:2235 start_codon:yes stop_codon:yes gene_type:complete